MSRQGPRHIAAPDDEDEIDPFKSRPKVGLESSIVVKATPAEKNENTDDQRPAAKRAPPPAARQPVPSKKPIEQPPKPIYRPAPQKPPVYDDDDDDDYGENDDDEDNDDNDENDGSDNGDDDDADEAPTRYDVGETALGTCRICKHKFALDRLAKHEPICARAHKAKKRVFDARKMRLAGTEAAQYAAHIDDKAKPVKKKNYKLEHERLVQQLRQANAAKGDAAPAGFGMHEEFEDDERVGCPHCGRKFSSDVISKHIPSCQRMNAGKAPLTNKGAPAGRYGRR
jgi:hypothetical protein